MVNDMEVEGKSIDGAFIDEETEIEIVRIDSYHVLVRRKQTPMHQ